MSNFAAAEKFVEFGLKAKAAGERESASGPGSAIKAAEVASWLIDAFIPQAGIKTVLDLGCGDWNWMQHTQFINQTRHSADGNRSYTGWDAHNGLISHLNATHSSVNVMFEKKDIITDEYPHVDMIIARDVLFHLDKTLIKTVLKKARGACRFFLTNGFRAVDAQFDPKEYLGIKDWKFGILDLSDPEFGLEQDKILMAEEPLARIREHKRYLTLYEFHPRG